MILAWWKRPKLRVLLVCRANVCRSPMGEALLRRRLGSMGLHRQVAVASAGTTAVRGQPPDPRAKAALAAAGCPPPRGASRPLTPRDFQRHNFILAVDRPVLDHLHHHCPDPLQDRLNLVTAWAEGLAGIEIPDPYYGSAVAFDRVRDLLDHALGHFVERALLPRLAQG